MFVNDCTYSPRNTDVSSNLSSTQPPTHPSAPSTEDAVETNAVAYRIFHPHPENPNILISPVVILSMVPEMFPPGIETTLTPNDISNLATSKLTAPDSPQKEQASLNGQELSTTSTKDETGTSKGETSQETPPNSELQPPFSTW